MKNKKGNRNKYLFKNILLGILSVIACCGVVKLLVPSVYSIFMSLFGVSVNLLSGVIIGGSVFCIVGLIGLATKCVEIKTEYVSDGMEIEPDLMRQQLQVVKSETVEVKPVNRFSYVYDNNYVDVEDIEIDDITNPNWRSDYGFDNMDEDVKVYVRKNR